MRILGRYVRPAVADVYARTQQPARIVLLTLKRTEEAVRCWVNRLNMPHNAAVIGAGARVKGWSTGRTYGSASAIVADRLDLGWPQDEEILPRTPEPPPLHVQSLLCISDSAGTLYPETVKGFKRLFGRQVPASVGASVTRKTGDIYRKWKKIAAINGRRSNSNPS